jgi:nitroreductase
MLRLYTQAVEVEEAADRMRTVRRYATDPISDPDRHAILDAGRHSGSSKNLQRWQFIVVRESENLRALSAVGEFAELLAGAALAIALITPDPHAPDAPLSVTWDLGRAAQNMMLVAWSRGIGSSPVTVYEQELCRELLGYPADQHCEFILAFGHPATPLALTRPQRAGGRRSLDEIVHTEKW